MKIKFRWGIKTFSGYGDDMVYESCLNSKVCIGRDYTYPKITENNHQVGAVGKNLGIVFNNVNPAYAQDLKTYRERYRQLGIPRNPFKRKPVAGPYSLFIKMMYNWLDSDPEHVNLTAVTIADIVALDADVCTIKRAIDAGFLPMVPVYDDLTAAIQ